MKVCMIKQCNDFAMNSVSILNRCHSFVRTFFDDLHIQIWSVFSCFNPIALLQWQKLPRVLAVLSEIGLRVKCI